MMKSKELNHFLQDLKKAGLVKSTRGAKGGYQLSQSPQVITVQSIISAIDPLTCSFDLSDPLSVFWGNLNSHVNQFFDLPLQAIMDDALQKEQVLTYTI